MALDDDVGGGADCSLVQVIKPPTVRGGEQKIDGTGFIRSFISGTEPPPRLEFNEGGNKEPLLTRRCLVFFID